MRPHWTLHRQLLVGMLLGSAVLVTVFAGLIWREQQSFVALRDGGERMISDLIREGTEQRGITLARQYARAVANPLYFLDFERIGELGGHVQDQDGVLEVLLTDAEGRRISDGRGDLARFGEPVPALPTEARRVPAGPSGAEAVLHWAEAQLQVEVPVQMGEHRIGRVRLVLGDADSASMAVWGNTVEQVLRDNQRAHVFWLLAGMGLIVLLAVIGFWLFRRNVLAPLQALGRAAAAVEQGRYAETRALQPRSDEIGDLTRRFIHMAEAVARHEREVRRIACTDALTGLGNRLALSESLESRLLTLRANSGELALLFIDLDDIKRVNDTLGHPVGDEVLVEIAVRLTAACEAVVPDATELARFGGDEFVVLLVGNAVRQQAAVLAQAILAAVHRPMPLRERELNLSASIGITVFPDDAASAEQLIKNADMAMYQAKTSGKGRFKFYTRALDEEVERRVRLEHDLRGAWERGEMSLVFQPVYDLTDGRAVGAEALLRWKHPDLGLVPPSVFIGIAEESGQVEALGEHVLREAMRVAMGWVAPPGLPAPFVAINVSPRQLAHGDLPQVVERALAESGLPAQRLHLELTETAILRDEAQATAAFTRLRSLGVGVWLDDFGTGFSGLSHLRRVPVDGVKIDRSFITDLLRDPNDLALTTGVIAMARSLGMAVVAEGIESDGQHDLLRERGCPMGQGFFMARPLDAAAVGRMFS